MLKNWAQKDPVRFNRAKCKVLHLDHSSPHYQYKLGNERIEHSPAEKDLGVLVGGKVDMSPESKLYPGQHQKKHGQQVKGGDPVPLL